MMPYQVTVAYNTYSSVIAGAATMADAYEELNSSVAYYQALGYPIRETTIVAVCPTCENMGRVRKCRHTEHIVDMPGCYKLCPTCRGKVVTIS